MENKEVIVAEQAVGELVETSPYARAHEVREIFNKIKDNVETSFFDMCDLLLEAQEGDYHKVWGFAKFGDWVEQDSGLDISARQAFYYLSISKKARQLELTREDLKKVAISKLKHIFALDAETNGGTIKGLLKEAETEPLPKIRKKVAAVKSVTQAPDEPEEEYMTLKFDASVKEIVDKAFELARKNYGDTMGEGDISNSKCLELICLNYTQDPNNYPEGSEMDSQLPSLVG